MNPKWLPGVERRLNLTKLEKQHDKSNTEYKINY